MTALCSKGCGRRATRRGWCNAHYQQQWTRLRAYGRRESAYTDAEPVRMHIKQLQAAGIGLRRISELSGVNRKTLQWITTGRSERNSPPSSKVTSVNAEKILAVPLPDRPHQLTAGHQLVPALGTVRRLRALVRFGYTRSHLAARLDMHPYNVTRLFRNTDGQVFADTARRVEELFNELQLTPGPSVRAVHEGTRRRWAPPFAWDEFAIDDAEARPVRADSDGGKAGAEALDARRARVAELTALGWSATRIAEHLRISSRQVVRDRAALSEAEAS